MSRCLMFPPPGYAWNGVSGEALLELSKVQGERVKAERAKKKEERRRKKEKKKEREQGEILQKKRDHHKRHKRLTINGGNDIRSENEYATLGVERSSLSDELEQPIPDSLYASSDNSQSIQRKRKYRSCVECQNDGSIIQIDFQLQKQKNPEASKPDCSTELIDFAVQKKVELSVEKRFSSDFGLPDNDVQEFAPPLREFCHSSQRARVDMDEKSEMALTESLYRELVVNWTPPPLQIEHFDVGDQDWLFEKKPPRSDIRDTSTASYDDLPQGNFASYPHAQYLPQANIYALPYTIPY